MKSKSTKVLILFLMLMPIFVYASNGNNDFPIIGAIQMEAFISIFMSIFVLKPLADIFSKENSRKTFWTLFVIRAVILIFCDFFVTPFVAIVDFFLFFICAFTVVPICARVTNTQINRNNIQVMNRTTPLENRHFLNQINGIELKCAKCGSRLQVTDNYCSTCGEPFEGNNVVVSENVNGFVQKSLKTTVSPSNFDSMYSMTEDKMLE